MSRRTARQPWLAARSPASCAYSAAETTGSGSPHRQNLQPQFADGAGIDRLEIGVADMSFRETREQPRDRNGDRRAAEDVSDAVMRPRAERQDPLWLAVNVEAERIGENI